MKSILTLSFMLFAVCLFSQTPDSSSVINDIDNNIDTIKNLIAQRDLENAFNQTQTYKQKTLTFTGANSEQYGTLWFYEGLIYHMAGQLDSAENAYLICRDIRKKIFGKNHLQYTKPLNNLAVLYSSIGQIDEAAELFEEVLAIRLKLFGEEDPTCLKSKRTLADLYVTIGKYEDAAKLYQTSLEIHENKLNASDNDYPACLMGLALLAMETGDFEEAEIQFLKTQKLLENTLGVNHENYALALNNIGNLYFSIGNYEKALPYHKEALDIRTTLFEEGHPDRNQSLQNLASLYLLMDDPDQSLRLYQKSLKNIETNLGKQHTDYANTIGNLAIIHSRLGDLNKAEIYFLNARDLYATILGKDHPAYANSLNNLADHYYEKGDITQAIAVFEEAKDIMFKAHGTGHLDYLSILKGLALAESKMGNTKKAMGYLSQVAEQQQKIILKAIHHLSEHELQQYQKMLQKTQSQIFELAIKHRHQTQVPFNEVVANEALFYKGFLLNTAIKIRQSARNDSTTVNLYNNLKSYNRRLAEVYVTYPIDSVSLLNIESKTNALEKELHRKIEGMQEALQPIRWKEVQQSLKEKELAIEFIHFPIEKTDSIIYAALLTGTNYKQPILVPLFEQKELDLLLVNSGDRKADYVNRLYAITDRGVSPINRTTKSIYELIWKPLEKHLPANGKIYFSLSGSLHQLNMSAIPVDEETILSDHFDLVQLSSSRQLVKGLQASNYENKVMLMGGIQYDPDSLDLQEAQNIPEDAVASRNRQPTNNNLPKTWKKLRWTQAETSAIGDLFKEKNWAVTLLQGEAAREEKIKSISSNNAPRVLHIATHGYFFSNADATPSENPASSPSVFQQSSQTMIRSGLLLAGGNYAWVNGRPFASKMEDGILTAFEVSQLNLSNNELVVLSACETGLGEIHQTEGVYGLQRAFKIAGSKYLIMALWQVPDFQTQDLMKTFYNNWLKLNMTIPDAFKAAQKEMREKYWNPYFWAGFVLLE